MTADGSLVVDSEYTIMSQRVRGAALILGRCSGTHFQRSPIVIYPREAMQLDTISIRATLPTLFLMAGLGSAQAEPQSWKCLTTTERLAPDTFTGVCPTEGSCDVPSIRDPFVPDATTPIRWFKLHIIVFRADDGSDPAETPADIDGQMATLNADYLPHNIQFTYTWEYVDDSTWRYSSGASSSMKDMNAQDPANQCNIFINNLPGGVGTFPWSDSALTNQGGVVIGRDFFSPIHHVLTHEMGHNLGLWHMHHGVEEVSFCGSCYERADGTDGDTTGDFADDTPPGPSDFGSCFPPGGNDSCSATPWGDTQRENYMSYGSGDGIACWSSFSSKQAGRMHCWTSSALSSWLDCNVGDDCNSNFISDYCDIRDGFSLDTNGNFIPDECESVMATVTPYNGSGTNLDRLDASAVVVGANWDVTLTPQAGRGSGAWIILLRSNSVAGPSFDLGLLFGLPAAGVSELLVDPVSYLTNFAPGQHTGGGAPAMFSTPVPLDSSLVANGWFAQAVVLGDLPAGAGALDPWFSRATSGTIGTF